MIALPDRRGLQRAVALLRAGRLVAFPTETVYGLGANASREDAVRGLFAAKGRPADHPVIVHLADARGAEAWAARMPEEARRLAAAFWPGPLTLIVPRAPGVHDVVTGGQDTVGLRVPAHPVAQALLQAFGGGIAGPSANRFGRISPTTALHVADDLGDRVDLILDGGACPVGIESTIVACLGDAPMLMRPGGVDAEALAQVLGHPLRARHDDAPRASGTLASHYAPRTPARLVAAGALDTALDASDGRVAVLAIGTEAQHGFEGTWIDAPAEPAGYARALYANLRTLDRSGAAVILVESPPATPDWDAVTDRLARAAHPDGATPEDDFD